MKKILINFICGAAGVLIFQACSKEPSFDYAPDTVGSSRVIYFPSVEVKGERTIILDQGTPWTDPGVTAMLNGQPITATSAVTVNTNVPGVYNLEYVASNPEGYTASDWRTVVVVSNSAQVTNNNLAGTYRRDNGINATWTKTARGIYAVDNPGGAAVGVGFIVTLVNYDANKIAIPRQLAFDPSTGGLNTISSNTESYNATSTPIAVKYALTAVGYGAQVRNFTKQ
jgi:Bacterial surface protein, Ig-like domain